MKNDLVVDVLVCGCGSSGLVAGLTARHGGANVIIFEKRDLPGGTSLFAEGLFAVESAWQIRKKIGMTRDEAFKKHMDYSHWRANARLVRAFIDKSASSIDWLQQQGVEFDEPTAYFPGGPHVFHWIKGGGEKLIEKLFAKAKENGVQIYLGASVKNLLVDEANRIAGAIGEDKNGHTIGVKAKVVIVSTGDFADNKEMLEKYTEFGHIAISRFGNMNRTGDGIQMAWAIDAAHEGTNVLLADPWVPGEKRNSYLRAIAVQPYLIWVNHHGVRFFPEDVRNPPFVGNALANQMNGTMWVIFDESAKEFMIEGGIRFGAFATGAKFVELNAEIERGIRQGKAFVANTLEELAQKIGVDGKVLEGSIDEYNRFCEQKHDDIFAKDPNHLQPVKRPRFYAIKCCFTLTATLGGIKINEKTEVLNKRREVIAGLYATGSCAGGFYGDSYDMVNTTGGALGFAINTGRIAGENVLKYIGK